MVQPLNQKLTVQVVGIELKSSGFTRKSDGVFMNCHTCSLLLSDDEEIIKAQMCVEENSIPWFKVDDKIEITISDYKPGKSVPYTFKYISTLKMSTMGNASSGHTGEALPAGYNPMVGGTVADRSLAHAIALVNGQKIPAIKKGSEGVKEAGDSTNLVINIANIFKDYFLNNL